MRDRMEAGDLLMLLAGQAQADDYELPAERLAAELDDLAAAPAPGGTGPTDDRITRIAAAAAETGGEVN